MKESQKVFLAEEKSATSKNLHARKKQQQELVADEDTED